MKYLEFSALGIPGVYSRLAPYESLISDGESGFLATSADEWDAALSSLIEQEELRRDIGLAARETVLKNWLLSAHADAWRQLYTGLMNASSRGDETPTRLGIRVTHEIMKACARLAPPGTWRGELLDLPARSLQVLTNEGLAGLSKRLRARLDPPAHEEKIELPFKIQTGSPPTTWLPKATYKLGDRAVPEKPAPQSASLIILTHNNLNYTRLCLESLFQYTDFRDWEVIVVDNASQDGTPEFLRTYAAHNPRLQPLLNQENLGFAHGNNLGAQKARGDLLVFLNNDIVLTPGWLENLAAYLRDPHVGLVGPLTNSSGNESRISAPYRNLQELESFARSISGANKGRAFNISMLAFFCVALRRDVFLEVGGLDERFGLGMFEDDDYAERVRRAGLKILCTQDVFIHHWGSASFTRLNNRQFFQLHKQNQRLFEEKWNRPWQPQAEHSHV